MSLKNNTATLGVLLLGAIIILSLVFVYTTKTRSNIVATQTNSSTSDAIIEGKMLDEVLDVLKNPKEFYVIGEVASVENNSVKVKLLPQFGYSSEGTMLVNIGAETLLFSVANKEPEIYEKEIKEFVNNNSQGNQPKTFIEKEISLNEIQVGDRITAVSFNEVSTTTTSFIAKSISIQKIPTEMQRVLPMPTSTPSSGEIKQRIKMLDDAGIKYPTPVDE